MGTQSELTQTADMQTQRGHLVSAINNIERKIKQASKKNNLTKLEHLKKTLVHKQEALRMFDEKTIHHTQEVEVDHTQEEHELAQESGNKDIPEMDPQDVDVVTDGHRLHPRVLYKLMEIKIQNFINEQLPENFDDLVNTVKENIDGFTPEYYDQDDDLDGNIKVFIIPRELSKLIRGEDIPPSEMQQLVRVCRSTQLANFIRQYKKEHHGI